MPELPEVETVRRGLAPVMEGSVIRKVELRRPDLRFPLPDRFAERLTGVRIERLDRRGKYLLAALSSGETLISHLGMSGRFTISRPSHAPAEKKVRVKPGGFHFAPPALEKHDHIVFVLEDGTAARKSAATIVYNDPRRFGFMDLAATPEIDASRHFAGMGPEPLGDGFSAGAFNAALKRRATPVKAALLDQKVVAGIGNIYACEALFRARISPRRRAASVAGVRGERLQEAVVRVLRDAIEAGGSTLRDFAGSDGELGYFQHRFEVYDREGEPCVKCGAEIRRIVQSGRSTFYCPACQR